ncbi:hypothetical protein HYH03_013531 [Edaphochlamys debaryana]|uniref:Phage tail collar domain-containing protein n=1 Tax=Edaphochlamys debaryana TaxID=47281 RepID=A0A835XN54_9CHLO|nr:hypothetical protein HYH03_013531 [Edaphochlamys debaryana]|eukprot:KAG2487952.1 hypothetical protein HYH03_013531 [Edaphochlamys debaryana]
MRPRVCLGAALLLLSALLLAAWPRPAGAQATSAAANCAMVLKQGVYNTLTQTSTASAYSSVMSALCKSYSSYTFNSYASDRATLDSYIDQNAGKNSSNFHNDAFSKLASNYCKSSARSFDVAAQASYGKFSAGGSYSQADSASNCGAQSADSYTGKSGAQDSYFTGYNSKLSQSSYNDRKTAIEQTQSTMCGSNSAINQNSREVQYLSKIIDPNVYTSYTNCLSLYTSGVRIRQTSGVDSHSLSLDIQFVKGAYGAFAWLWGVSISPPNTASCRLLGCKGPGNITGCAAVERMNRKLTPNSMYTIVCEVTKTTPVDSAFTDVYVSTSGGGAYRGVLNHGLAVPHINQVNGRLAGDEWRTSRDVSSVKAMVAPLLTQLTLLMNKVNAVNASIQSKLSSLEWTNGNQIRQLNSYNSTLQSQLAISTMLPNAIMINADALNKVLRVPSGSILPHSVGVGYGVLPAGYLLCDGSAVSRTDYGTLYNQIGTTYGTGDGSSTFNLPDLRSRVPMGAGSGPGLTARSLGQRMGEEAHTLTTAELAKHTHSGTTYDSPSPSHARSILYTSFGTKGSQWGILDSSNSGSSCTGNCFDHTHNFTTDTGNGVWGWAHGNMQPYLTTAFMIKT